MPNMSKMTKPELYKLCKEQQERIKILDFHLGCSEEENEKLEEENEKLKQKVESLKYCWDGTIHTAREKIKELEEENEKLKNVICRPIINLNGINCSGKEKYIQSRIKEYEETIWKIKNGVRGF